MDENGYCRKSNGFLLADAGWLEAQMQLIRTYNRLSFTFKTNVEINIDGNVTKTEFRHPNGLPTAGRHNISIIMCNYNSIGLIPFRGLNDSPLAWKYFIGDPKSI